MTISDDTVDTALRIACGASPVGGGDGDTYVMSPPTLATMRAALEAVMPNLTPAAADVLAERRRQVEVEGWDAAHDAKHGSGDLAAAGGCYALGAAFLLTPGLRYREYVPAEVPRLWPWDARWWKLNGRDPRRGLVKAGALILAEIERLDRAGAKETRG